jgi:hypothetical protein
MEKSKNKKPSWWFKVLIDFPTIKWAIIWVLIRITSWNNWRINIWMCGLLYLMGNSNKKFPWSNWKGSKSKGKNIKCANEGRLFMAFDKPLELGILTLIHFFNNMAYKKVVLTIIFIITSLLYNIILF